MGRKPTVADEGAGAVIALLAKTVKSKHIKFQTIGPKLGKASSWFTGVVFRKHHMFLDDFLDVCRITGIDPILMLAANEEGGMLKYVKDLQIMDVVSSIVNARLAELLEGQDVIVRVPKAKKPGDDQANGERA